MKALLFASQQHEQGSWRDCVITRETSDRLLTLGELKVRRSSRIRLMFCALLLLLFYSISHLSIAIQLTRSDHLTYPQPITSSSAFI